MGERLVAVCWSDEASVLHAVNRPELLGPTSQGALELLEEFASERENLQVRGTTEPRVVAAFRYQLSFPLIVDGRAQYNLGVNLPAPLPAASIGGPVQEIVAFVNERYPDARMVNIDLVPMEPEETLGSVTMHFEQWNLRSVTITQYRSTD